MENNKVQYSRLAVISISIIISLISATVYLYKGLDRFELLTLDSRFTLNRIIPSYKLSDILPLDPVLDNADKASEKNPESKFNVILIDMPGTSERFPGYQNVSDLSMALKILTLWKAGAVVFTEPLPAFTGAAEDVDFVETVKFSEEVYLPVFYNLENKGPDGGSVITGIREPWQVISGDKNRLGHMSVLPGSYKRLRAFPVSLKYRGFETYNMGLKVAIDRLGIKPGDISLDNENHILSLKPESGENILVPLDKYNSIVIDWGSANKERFPRIAFRELLESFRLMQYGARPLVNPEVFKGKICILGTAGSNEIFNRPPLALSGFSMSAASGIVIDSILRGKFVKFLPNSVNAAIVFLVSLIFGIAMAEIRFLRVMMIVVIAVTLFNITAILWLPKNISLIVVIVLSVPLGMLFSASQLFSGLIFGILGILGYAALSVGFFRAFNLALPTFYPIFAIVLNLAGFYMYARFKGYLGTLRLFNLASRDGLTGLINRRYLNLMLDSELNSVTLDKSRKLSIVMCDIDNFKRLNDTHGHQAGDAILRKFAKVMKAKCRQSDIVARYGGEEFVMVFPGAGAAEALKIAEAVRQAISEENFTFKGQPYSTSMSMGLAQYSNERSKEDLIEKADQALYRAKKEGKNRVCQ